MKTLMISQCPHNTACNFHMDRVDNLPQEEWNNFVEPESPGVVQELLEGQELCPCQYVYWFNNPSPDSPHNTGLSEEWARKNRPDLAELADNR